jgi:hypothetical protein
MKTRIGLSIVVAIWMSGLTCAAHAADANVIREAQDRADIEVLIWNYTQALDNLDEDRYPTFFSQG